MNLKHSAVFERMEDKLEKRYPRELLDKYSKLTYWEMAQLDVFADLADDLIQADNDMQDAIDDRFTHKDLYGGI